MTPERFHKLRDTLARRQPDLTVLMDQVNKIHNFSAIVRSCDAVGVMEAHAVPPEGGVELSHGTSAGAKKWVGIRYHREITGAVDHLRSRGFRVVAANLGDRARDYREVDYTGPIALLVGAELHGVSPEGLAGSDEEVVIPMAGMVQSLNVSVASALILFEAQRQRLAAGLYDQVRIPDGEFASTLFEWAYPRLARMCREAGMPYPPLDEDGEIQGPLPGTVGSRETGSDAST
jgi:tRNA (guanosine-2'-O-)-methyltransferase